MVMFKSNVKFRGIKENKVFEAGEPFEMTVKRADEVLENIKKKHPKLDIEFERAEEAADDTQDDKEEE